MFGFSKNDLSASSASTPVDGADKTAAQDGGSGIARVMRALFQRRYLCIFFVLSAVINVAALIVVYTITELRHLVTHEDNLVENLTVLAFLVAVVAVGVMLIKNRTPRRYRSWLWFIGPIALLGLLDELSFGQRIFSLDSLNFRGNGIDAVHDFLLVGYESGSNYAVAHPVTTILLALTFIAIGIIVTWLGRHWISHRFTRSASRELWAMLAVFIALIGISQFLDLEILKSFRGFAVLIEELFELEAALILLFMLLAMTDPLKLYRRSSETVRTDGATTGAVAAAVDPAINAATERARS